MTSKPVFETFADATLGRVRATYAQRGTEYSDTWKNPPWLALKATISKLGLDVDEKFLRAIGAAVLYDVKYGRLSGGYKDDSVIDGIAYGALWCEEMRQLMEDKVVATNGNGHDLLPYEDYKERFLRDRMNLAGQTRQPETAPATPSV